MTLANQIQILDLSAAFTFKQKHWEMKTLNFKTVKKTTGNNSFSRMHHKSQIINKRNPWKVIIVYIKALKKINKFRMTIISKPESKSLQTVFNNIPSALRLTPHKKKKLLISCNTKTYGKS